MTTVEKFKIKPADVLKTPKSVAGAIKHFVVFECIDNSGVEWYLENIRNHGVRRIKGHIFEKENTVLGVIKFEGTEEERAAAIERATSQIGKPYSLLNFNCEHYANFAQTGKAKSKQLRNIVASAAALVGVSLLIGAFAKGRGKKEQTSSESV